MSSALRRWLDLLARDLAAVWSSRGPHPDADAFLPRQDDQRSAGVNSRRLGGCVLYLRRMLRAQCTHRGSYEQPSQPAALLAVGRRESTALGRITSAQPGSAAQLIPSGAASARQGRGAPAAALASPRPLVNVARPSPSLSLSTDVSRAIVHFEPTVSYPGTSKGRGSSKNPCAGWVSRLLLRERGRGRSEDGSRPEGGRSSAASGRREGRV